MRTLPLVLALGLSLQGCMFSPGQHMDTANIVREGSPESAGLELIPITPKLIAIESALQSERQAIPQELLSYQPGDYRVGPGDLLYITVWDHPELTSPAGNQQQAESNGRLVRADGTLFYPYVGVVDVNGKSVEELRSLLAERLRAYIPSPQVDVGVLRYGSQKVVLSGAFKTPEAVEVSYTPLTLLEAVSRGGVDPMTANFASLTLRRDGHEYRLDMDALNRRGSELGNIYLKGGDQIHLAYNDSSKIYVMGEVFLPKALPFRTTSMSLTEAIGSVGGLAQETSAGGEVYVIRGVEDPSGEPARIFQLDARSPSAFALANHFKLQPQDVVYVGPANVTRWNRFISQVFPSANLLRTGVAIQDDYRDNNN